MGIAVVDILCGSHLVQGILAALIRRAKTGTGAHIEVSLLESILDFQFEVITTHLADGGRLPQRSKRFNAHAYLSAPYGVYPTKDGYLALAMGDLIRIARLIGCHALEVYGDSGTWFTRRDEIQQILADHLRARPTAHWLAVLQAAGVWCSDVFDYARLLAHESWHALGMDQVVRRDGVEIHTTRCPIRINNQILLSPKAAPRVGEDNKRILEELDHA
jgi:crotonobetainyl-CoA:carnitine CoA-transferase CaiB-like acyl-CoA transferase